MSAIIDNIDFQELPSEKYWSYPKTYKGNKHEDIKRRITSGAYLCSIKKDGHYCRFIKDDNGQIRMQGRTKGVEGEYLDKHEWVPQLNNFFAAIPNGTCFLGELYFPHQSGSRKVTTILGCLQSKAIERQEKGEKLHYYIFDVWAWNGKSCLNKTLDERVAILQEVKTYYKTDFVEFAEFYEGEEAWDKLGEALEAGEEGMVAIQRVSKPEPDKRTSYKSIKIKKEINQTIDAFIDGSYKEPTREYSGKSIETWALWYNVKTSERYNTNQFKEYCAGAPIIPVTKPFFYNYAGAISFSVMKDGKPVHIGYISGVSDEMKAGIVKEPEKWVGRVFEISCMEVEKTGISETGYSLRHAKVIGERVDKKPEDCDFSQISG